MTDPWMIVYLDESCYCCKYCDYYYPCHAYKHAELYKAALVVIEHMMVYHKSQSHEYLDAMCTHTRSYSDRELAYEQNQDLRKINITFQNNLP